MELFESRYKMLRAVEPALIPNIRDRGIGFCKQDTGVNKPNGAEVAVRGFLCKSAEQPAEMKRANMTVFRELLQGNRFPEMLQDIIPGFFNGRDMQLFHLIGQRSRCLRSTQ